MRTCRTSPSMKYISVHRSVEPLVKGNLRTRKSQILARIDKDNLYWIMPLEGHSNGTWALKALGYSSTRDTQVAWVLGHLYTQALSAVGHLDARGTLFSRVFWQIVLVELQFLSFYVIYSWFLLQILFERYTNADLKICQHLRLHIKTRETINVSTIAVIHYFS